MSAIGPDDIEAFAMDAGPNIAAAIAFRRAAESGIPPDRWATTQAMFAVARGIRAMEAMLAWYAEFAAASLKSGADSMDLGPPRKD